jgi:AraC-type DNA-binding domain-containing proteins
MSIYASEFDFDPLFSFSVSSYNLKRSDNVRNTYHWHSCFEFTSIRKGKAIYYIGEKSYCVKQGDYILFNPTQYHGWEILTETMEVLVILFPFSFVRDILINYHGRYLKSFLEQGGYYQNYIENCDEYARELKPLILSVEKEYNQKASGYQFMVQMDIIKLLMLLTRHYIKSGGNTVDFQLRAEAAKRLEPVMLYLYHNYSEKITLDQMADLCCMSPSYFSAYFKKSCGCSFIHYLNELRTQQARKLILTTDKSILEISLDCGFRNLSNFYRIYQKLIGETPGMERKMI